MVLRGITLLGIRFGSSCFSLVVLCAGVIVPPDNGRAVVGGRGRLGLRTEVLVRAVLGRRRDFGSVTQRLNGSYAAVSGRVGTRVYFRGANTLNESFGSYHITFLRRYSLRGFYRRYTCSGGGPY